MSTGRGAPGGLGGRSRGGSGGRRRGAARRKRRGLASGEAEKTTHSGNGGSAAVGRGRGRERRGDGARTPGGCGQGRGAGRSGAHGRGAAGKEPAAGGIARCSSPRRPHLASLAFLFPSVRLARRQALLPFPPALRPPLPAAVPAAVGRPGLPTRGRPGSAAPSPGGAGAAPAPRRGGRPPPAAEDAAFLWLRDLPCGPVPARARVCPHRPKMAFKVHF